MKSKILIATGNKHKKDRLSWIVKDYFDQIEYPEDLGLNIEVEENGETFEDNAKLKAEAYSKVYDGFTIATDGGMIIPSLGENWNPLRTKRFAGENIDDFERIRLLLEIMKDKKGDERIMNWKEAIAIAKDGKTVFSKQVEDDMGLIQETFDPLKYRTGIWVCSLWYIPQFQKNYFDLTEKEQREVERSWTRLYNTTHGYLDTITN